MAVGLGPLEQRRNLQLAAAAKQGCNSIDILFRMALTRTLTIALSGAFLNAFLTPALTCVLTQALNSKISIELHPSVICAAAASIFETEAIELNVNQLATPGGEDKESWMDSLSLSQVNETKSNHQHFIKVK